MVSDGSLHPADEALYFFRQGQAREYLPAQYRFNEFSAVPSIHIAWSLIVMSVIVCLVSWRWLKVVALGYPFLVLMVIVVTGNHYIFDGMVAALDVVVAGGVALALEPLRKKLITSLKTQLRPRLSLGLPPAHGASVPEIFGAGARGAK